MNRRRLYNVKKIGLLGLLVALILCTQTACQGNNPREEGEEKTAKTPLVETGELVAVRSKALLTPDLRRWGNLRVTWVEEHGKEVLAGDSVIQLDPADITKYILERETQLESAQASLDKMLINQANRDSETESTIRSDEATYELRKLELESSRFESERTRKIKGLEFEQATIALRISRLRLEINKIVNENDIKIQKIKVEQIKKDIEMAWEAVPMLTVRTPVDGILQLERRRGGQLIKVGDEVWRGNRMAMVPELKHMKVRTFVNENDFLRVHKGQKVIVRLDALPEVPFEAEVSSMGLFCHPRDYNNPRQKGFDVELKLLVSDERLKTGMTVSCEFLEDE
ncbi:MAG: HlyD family efflux transporter periplasmic adaptor subunit [Bacteroidaceae bacterium]|nr:HlyD family efflux transporter periplasmic adaptor subunit [Bacteroidaceae bacterium]MBO5886164.1 HlyD family efflux transporter periplasmic adaptor subunit [Bacteroidaceae bacterium]